MKKVSIYILLLLGVFFASCNGNGYSNELEEEEQLILQEDYKKLVCLSIFAGVLKFLAL